MHVLFFRNGPHNYAHYAHNYIIYYHLPISSITDLYVSLGASRGFGLGCKYGDDWESGRGHDVESPSRDLMLADGCSSSNLNGLLFKTSCSPQTYHQDRIKINKYGFVFKKKGQKRYTPRTTVTVFELAVARRFAQSPALPPLIDAVSFGPFADAAIVWRQGL